MALRINQNVAAMNARRNLDGTDSALSKSLERLSSGLRVNRASDDPAALVLSENLRSQISGLGQAIANSTDAVNMIKTAEAALDEVNRQIVSMRSLALHAANIGANDEAGRRADQAQIESSLQALDRIAQTTRFGSKTLLDGASGVSGTSSNTEITVESGTAATRSGTYAVNITAVARRSSATSSNRQVAQITAAAPGATVNAIAVTGTNGVTGTDYGVLQFGGALLDNSTVDIRVNAGDTLQDIIDRINTNPSLGSKVVASLDADGTSLVFTSRYLDNTPGSLTVQALDGAGGTGTAENVVAFTGVNNGAAVNSAATVATRSALLAWGETLTLKDDVLNRSVQVSLLKGDSLESVVGKINRQAREAGVRVEAVLVNNSSIMFRNTAYGSATAAQVTVSSVFTPAAGAPAAASSANLGLVGDSLILNGTDTSNAATGQYVASGLVAGADVQGDINGEPATGTGQMLVGNSGNPNTDGLALKVTASALSSALVAQVTIVQGSAVFQIGPDEGDSVGLSIPSTATDKLGTTATGLTTSAQSLADLDVTTLDGAQDALRILDAAQSQISSLRAELGAFQKNSLESTIRSMEIARENMASSESAIRDADMAAEMVDFTRNNIMVQAGTAMLAQANQTPQMVLQLLQR